MKKLIIISAILVNAYASPTPTPSFNCKYAKTRAEKFICSNLFVADLDVRMALTYRKIVKLYPSKASVMRKRQAIWMRNRDNCTNNFQGKDDFSSCIKYIYNKRIEELEHIIPQKLNQTDSRIYYKKGNKAYRAGNYYESMNYFTKAYNASDNYIDKIRALGAMSVNSMKQNNYLVARRYAKIILRIDSTNDFARDIINQCEPYIKRYEKKKSSKSVTHLSSSSNSYKTINQDGCSQEKPILACSPSERDNKAFSMCAITMGGCEVAIKTLKNSTQRLASSQACSALSSKLIGQKYELDDVLGGLFVDGLNEIANSSFESDDKFINFMGVIFAGGALVGKAVQLDKCRIKAKKICTRKYNNWKYNCR